MVLLNVMSFPDGESLVVFDIIEDGKRAVEDGLFGC
jgi:hypothetical protein